MSKYAQVFRKSESLKPTSTHGKVLHLVGKNRKVIDFGCASGYLDEILIRKFGCRVWGIEADLDDAKKASKILKKVIIADIEKTSDWIKKLGDEKFEVAIFADVLEHLRNPLEVLKATKKVLSKNGYVVASIPNVAHLSVRLELLLGQWKYEPIGLLDDTHVRFFTHREIVDTFHKAGFYITNIDPKIEEIPKEVVAEYLAKEGVNLTKDLETLFSSTDARVFQYIIRASLKKPVGYQKVKATVIPKLINEWGRKKFEMQSLKAKNRLLQSDLTRITSSKAYRLWQAFARIRRFIFHGK